MHNIEEYELHSIIQQTTLTLPMGSVGKVARLAHSSMPNCREQSNISSAQRFDGIPHESCSVRILWIRALILFAELSF